MAERTGDFVQIVGPFPARRNLYNRIVASNQFAQGIFHFGLQAKPGTKVIISEDERSPASENYLIVGKSGILEYTDAKIGYIAFIEPQNSTTIIDCLLD